MHDAVVLPGLLKTLKASSFCRGTESAYNTAVVDFGPVGSVGCVARVPSMARL